MCEMLNRVQTNVNTSIYILGNIIKYIQKGLWVNDSPLLQIAYFDEEKFSKFSKRCKKTPNLLEILQTPPDQRKLNIPEEDREEFNKQLSLFPNLKVETIIEVTEEKEIVEGDIVSIKVKMTRENLPEKEEVRGVHSLRYPHIKEEKWIVILADEDKNLIIYLKIVYFIYKYQTFY